MAYDNLANALPNQDKLAEPDDVLRGFVRLRPPDVRALNKLARALVIVPKRPPLDYDEALNHARKAVELAPGYDNLKTLALA